MLTVFDIADYFISKNHLNYNDEVKYDYITNMKLQKLVYYAQGVYTGIVETPLFKETIEAWTYGPISPDLYHKFKIFENKPITWPDYCPEKMAKLSARAFC
jgi:uncharacterized phage-associated protein